MLPLKSPLIAFLAFLFTITSIEAATPRETEAENSVGLKSVHDYSGAEKHISLTSLEGEPSALVFNCVNVITGTFCQTSIDLIVPHPTQPLYVQRTFGGSTDFLGTLGLGWNINHSSIFKRTKREKHHKGAKWACYEDQGGYFQLEQTPKFIVNAVFCIDEEFLKKGVTNTGHGVLSAQTNLKNYYGTSLSDDQYVLTSGSRRVRSYKRLKHDPKHMYRLWLDARPSGFNIRYRYAESSKTQKLVYASLHSTSNRECGRLYFDPFDRERLRQGAAWVVKTNSNGQVAYFFEKARGKYLRLRRVERSHGPRETYTYKDGENGACLLAQRKLPNHRTLGIDYYHKGKNGVGRFTINLKKSADPIINRVKFLMAPAGSDETLVPIYTFYYDINSVYEETVEINVEKLKEVKEGSCTVLDALNYVTRYAYDANSRLTEVVKYDLAGEYSKETLIWGGEDTPDHTLLLARTFQQQGRTLYARTYSYDTRGNVLEDALIGCLSGASNQQPVISSVGKNETPHIEAYIKHYRYSDDGFNLLLEEDDGFLKTVYKYVPESDQLAAKFHQSGNRILQRWFYIYDGDRNLVRLIEDDGSSELADDLTDVHERHITDSIPNSKPPFGYPIEVEEKCLDLATGREILIHKVINTYSAQAKMTSQEHYDNHGEFAYRLTWDYDSMGNVTRETDPIGSVTTRKYDKLGNCTYVSGPKKGFYTEYSYDFMNRLIKEEEIHDDGLRLVTSHRYDLAGNRTATIDPYGNETNFKHDPFGRIIEITHPPVVDDAGVWYRPALLREYDALGNLVRETDPRGHTKLMRYNIRGQLTQVVYPDGSIEQNEYNLNGSLRKTVARNGVETKYVHDTLGRPIKADIEGKGVAKTCTYVAMHVQTETDASGIETKYYYDPEGRLKSLVKGNSTTEYEYDPLGRQARIIEYTTTDKQDAIVTVYKHDFLDRIRSEQIEDINGYVLALCEYDFDDIAHTATVKRYDAHGIQRTITQTDSRGVPIAVIDPEGHKTLTKRSYRYINAHGQTVPYAEVTDPLGNVTVTEEDALGRIVRKEKRNSFGVVMQRQWMRYDRSGNCSVIEDEVIVDGNVKGSIVSRMEYDSCSRLVSAFEACGTPNQKQLRIRYDSAGRKQFLVKNDGVVIHYNYDLYGYLKELSSSDKTIHYVYTYDASGNPVQVEDKVEQRTTDRKYDTNNRNCFERLANGLTIAYENDILGRRRSLCLPDGSTIHYEYLGHYLAKVARKDKNGLLRYAHTYDAYDLSGLPIRETLPLACGTLQREYDALGRVKRIHVGCWEEAVTSYDGSGNLLASSISSCNSIQSTTYTYDALHQLIEEKGSQHHVYSYDSNCNRIAKDGREAHHNQLHQLEDDGRSQYTYDLNGNLIRKLIDGHSIEYAYDALDRLTTVTEADVKVKYTYDDMNRRMSKAIYHKQEGLWEQQNLFRYLYQEDCEIGMVDREGEIAELRILGHGLGAEVGATIAIELHGKVYVPLHDHRGNVASILDGATGALFETYTYTAFGEELFENPLSPWRFSSKRVDDETGFVYFGRRYYDPQTGRWTTPDPIGREGGLNLYAYVFNQPLTHIDPYGQWAWLIPWGMLLNDLICTVGALIETSLCLVGTVFELVAQHFVPVPFVQEIGMMAGRLLQGPSARDKPSVWDRTPSKIITHVGKDPPDPRLRFFATNGVDTSEAKFREQLAEFSRALGGVTVYGVYNSSRGMLYDLLETVFQKFGLPTEVQIAAEKAFRAVWNTMGEYKDSAIFIVLAHSQGCETVHNLPSDLRRRIVVSGYAPARILQEDDFRYAINYINRFDIVPFADPIGLIKGIRQGNVTYLPTTYCPVLDHYLDSRNFKELRLQLGKNYQ